MDCNCPQQGALTEIPGLDCGINLNQIQRLAFQRGGVNFDSSLATPLDILELSTWQGLMTATDDTKIVVTPLIGGDPIIESGDAITNGGGDNSTLNGVEEVVGVNPSLFTCVFNELTTAIEKALKDLMCEKSLVVYFLLQGGKIACVEITPDQAYTGFLTQSLFVSDKNNAGFGSTDTNSFRFSLPSGWSEDLVILSPNFNPLTEL